MPYWKRFVFMTAKVIIETVAKVEATGSSPANGTTNASIDAAGQNALPTTAIGIRKSSRVENFAWVSVRVVITGPFRSMRGTLLPGTWDGPPGRGTARRG